MIAYCPTSNFRAQAEFSTLRCPNTNEPLEYTDLPPFDPNAIDPTQMGLWRYAAMLPVVAPDRERISLGEGWTPLIADRWQGVSLYWKMESLMPTGSYKDRGFSVLINWLLGLNASLVVEDSSGNAGASLACYAARAKLQACVYVPSTAAAPKKAQIAVYGAELVEVPGPREAATAAAVAATRLNKGTRYASHALQPAYLLGQMTCAWEIWEQLGRRAPDWYIAPAGQGGQLLSVWRGFQQLHKAGLIDRLPRLAAVQAEPFTPIFDAFHNGQNRATTPCAPLGQNSADGIAITHPLRSVTVLTALRRSGGTVISVTEEELMDAQMELAGQGIYVEPTSATVAAAIEKLRPSLQSTQTVVAVLTGSGLKKTPTID